MEDNEIECTNCGATISLDLTRCPHCGMNLYPEDEEGEYTPRRVGADELWPGARVRTVKAPHKKPRLGTTIEETELSVILSLPASRKKDWLDLVKNLFGPLVITAMLIAVILTGPPSTGWAILIGVVAIVVLLYCLLSFAFGREVIEVYREEIVISFVLFGLKRRRIYEAHRITDLRITETTYQRRTRPFGYTKPAIHIWSTEFDWGTSALACEYDGKTIPLIGWIHKPLARSFFALVKQRFPNYR